MGTGIEYVDETWNVVTGCTPVSEGCDHCYAKRMANRMRGRFGYDRDDPFKVTEHPDRFRQPLWWKKPRRIFACSMGDLFHKDVTLFCLHQMWEVMRECLQHTFLLLTKRPQRMKHFCQWHEQHFGPVRNIWLGVTAENQRTADERIPVLLDIPAAVRFVSVEPMLEPVSLAKWMHPQCEETAGDWGDEPDWVIAGGETGPGARRMELVWARQLRDQCAEAGVPFFFKKVDSYTPTPPDLCVWQYPKGGCND